MQTVCDYTVCAFVYNNYACVWSITANGYVHVSSLFRDVPEIYRYYIIIKHVLYTIMK